ncbi:hypothetical protein [Chryseobacterium oryctis]|uniref:Lipoprotein n=1 Tax=Chryseobacterium oryctis TaxID=2952618 RepID=A0ABT3HK62_9FLAO|nr:hypothetical protein [Chryseobacterium oryctis]MCW3160157.1 hypothetical protein [Chryseobacterium oryctis]
MKNIFIFILTISFLLSCKQTENKSAEILNKENKSLEEKFIPKYGKSFFEFDEIEYYHTDISEDKAMDLLDTQNKSKNDKLKFEIILDEKPTNLKSLSFISKLTEIGFTKSSIHKSKFKDIKQIFTEKTVYESYAAACIAVYRDILVFKKDKEIIGLCKICFDCRLFRIVGTDSNTENFGQDGDFEKLAKLLKE